MFRFVAIALAFAFSGVAFGAPPELMLARAGKPLVAVVVAENATPRMKQAAGELANYLSKITSGRFDVKVGDGRKGIAVGLPSHFPALPTRDKWGKHVIAEREDYLLQTHGEGAYLIGATEQAVEHAVWDFLHRVGFRQFFPGERWEVVPNLPNLAIAVDANESPAYRNRRIWYGFGAWDYAKEPYAKWCVRNRATGGMELHTGHAYDGIVAAHRKEFDAHPEYFALVDGKRRTGGNPKFCISNPDLRELVVRHAVGKFRQTPTLDSISLDPSDGGGWCECDKCIKMGSVSDRALTLANQAALAVNAEFKDKYIGMYAYNYHSSPPSIKADSHVIISVATAFLKGGISLNDIIAGWSKQGATIGIREYYSVNTWDRDLPGHSRGSNIEYLKRTIPEFHVKGARFMSAESSDNWGPNGLGYYLAARMLWDVSEAKRTDDLSDDFLIRTFGPAREPMREYFRQLDGSKPHLVADDQLGRMFQSLAEARKRASADRAVLARIDDLVLYARYVSLFQRYSVANGTARQQAFESLIRHAYRMRTTMLVHTLALYRDLAGRDKSVTIPTEAKWNVPEGKNPWKSSEAFTEADITAFLGDGMQRHPLVKIDFQPVVFSSNLVPAASALNLPNTAAADLGAGRGTQTYLVHVAQAPSDIELSITGGLIAHYRDRGNVKILLHQVGGASETGEKETLVAADKSVPPDGKDHAVKLRVKESGLYKLTISDGMDRTQVKFKTELPFVEPSSAGLPMNRYHGAWTMYFYVPKGTRVVGLFGGEQGEIQDGQNKTVFSLSDRKPNYYGVPVPEGQDGKVWRVRSARGDVRLLTVPPYFATSPKQLLIPTEVLEKERNPK